MQIRQQFGTPCVQPAETAVAYDVVNKRSCCALRFDSNDSYIYAPSSVVSETGGRVLQLIPDLSTPDLVSAGCHHVFVSALHVSIFDTVAELQVILLLPDCNHILRILITVVNKE